jgi:hypothetical protein
MFIEYMHYNNNHDVIKSKIHTAVKMPRCVALKTNGTQCKCNALIGSTFCGTHQDWTAVFEMPHSSSTFDEDYVINIQDDTPIKKPRASIKGMMAIMDIIRR